MLCQQSMNCFASFSVSPYLREQTTAGRHHPHDHHEPCMYPLLHLTLSPSSPRPYSPPPPASNPPWWLLPSSRCSPCKLCGACPPPAPSSSRSRHSHSLLGWLSYRACSYSSTSLRSVAPDQAPALTPGQHPDPVFFLA